MKSTKSLVVLLALCLISGTLTAQIEGTNAFLMAPGQEIGIHTDGYEGSSVLPSFPTNYRGYSGRLGFLSNPQDDGWTNFDGDFFMPGAPENRFGIEVGGVTYANSAATGSTIPSSGLSGYFEYGKCKFVEWNGSVGGVDILMTYKLDTTKNYYTVNVELTNTTSTDMNDVYFYKSLDPDNNQEIGWGFATTNTIESQPIYECSKALVSAKSNGGWQSYVGLGSLDSMCRVSYGGFYVNDGSDIWDATGGLTGTMGSSYYGDVAISICHRDEVLAAGASSEFQFVVVMSEDQVWEALAGLYSIDFEDGGTDFSDVCQDTLIIDTTSTAGGGPTYYLDTDDTVFTCTYEPFEVTVGGPEVNEYNWLWMDSLGIEIDTTPTTTFYPGTDPDTAYYCCVGTPIGCSDAPSIGFCFTMVTLQSPEIDIDDIVVGCGDSLDLADVVVTDTADVVGSVTTFHSEFPEDADDMDNLWGTSLLGEGDTAYVMIADTANGCYDVEIITYVQDSAEAGLSEITVAACNSTPLLDLNDYLVDADDDGNWEDANDPLSGAFDETNGLLTTASLDEGTYVFYYIVGGDPCPADTSIVTVNLCDQKGAGNDASLTACTPDVLTVDLNDLLDGDTGGSWEELSFTAGQFNTSTGIFSLKALPDGVYDFIYVVSSCSPCENDTATISIEIAPAPDADFSFTPSTGTTEESDIFFTNESDDADTYFWSFGDGENSTDESPSHTYPAVVGSYEVWLYASNDYGCTDSTSATIDIEEADGVCFFAPNTFTPDGNGVNKEFKPTLCDGLDIYDYHMTIYNRWGEIVFETYHFDQGWRGDYGDRGVAEEGIYIWQAEFGEVGSDKKHQLQGHITLLK